MKPCDHMTEVDAGTIVVLTHWSPELLVSCNIELRLRALRLRASEAGHVGTLTQCVVGSLASSIGRDSASQRTQDTSSDGSATTLCRVGSCFPSTRRSGAQQAGRKQHKYCGIDILGDTVCCW